MPTATKVNPTAAPPTPLADVELPADAPRWANPDRLLDLLVCHATGDPHGLAQHQKFWDQHRRRTEFRDHADTLSRAADAALAAARRAPDDGLTPQECEALADAADRAAALAKRYGSLYADKATGTWGYTADHPRARWLQHDQADEALSDGMLARTNRTAGACWRELQARQLDPTRRLPDGIAEADLRRHAATIIEWRQRLNRLLDQADPADAHEIGVLRRRLVAAGAA